ncbi:MAG: universal stress protein [Anaerolineae bacterium]|nr:MAG: universal stress protein [Anaerolineae bacterium]
MKDYSGAVRDFKRARDRAALENLVARLSSRSSELLSYEDVRQKVRATGVVSHSLQDVPLDAIVGSVNRYTDFTRRFLPKRDSDQSRWANVYQATSESAGLPPVDLYKIGEVFFVLDGHHRVSVSRQMGAEVIQAYVTEIRSKVPLDPTIQPDELIIKAEYADFLSRTGLNLLYPESDLNVTCAGKYQELLEHIEVHRYFMGLELEREISFEESVGHWYDTVYVPVVEIIHDLGLLERFPGRTETDLYLWLARYRAEKEAQLGWEIKDSAAAAALVDEFGDSRSTVFGRIGRNVLEVILPDSLEPSPDTGQWRREQQVDKKNISLFNDILVALSGDEISWVALEQAIEVAKREQARIKGLYVLREGENKDSQIVIDIHDRFQWRCTEVGVPFTFTVDKGPVAKTICSRARWVDLVVFNLSYPPKAEPAARLFSGIRKLINRCTRPLLVVPGKSYSISKAMLVFDGSPKSMEALYVATYIAGKWQLPLIVAINRSDEANDGKVIDKANKYLIDSGIEVEHFTLDDPIEEPLLELSKARECDLLIIGGYESSTIMGIIRDSSLDAILRKSSILTLVCQ